MSTNFRRWAARIVGTAAVPAVLALGVGASSASTQPAAATRVADSTQEIASITLTNASNGSSVKVPLGGTVSVDLKGDVGTGTEFLWSRPTISSPSVLRLRGESRVGAETRAVYVAAHTGSATIRSYERCEVTAPRHVCPQFILLWRVGVTVTP